MQQDDGGLSRSSSEARRYFLLPSRRLASQCGGVQCQDGVDRQAVIRGGRLGTYNTLTKQEVQLGKISEVISIFQYISDLLIQRTLTK